MFVSLQEQRHDNRLPPPGSFAQARTDDVPRVLPSLSSFGFDDRMDVDSRYEAKPSGQRHEVEVANTLASMASFNIKSPTLPSPTQSFSSVKSEGTVSTSVFIRSLAEAHARSRNDEVNQLSVLLARAPLS